MEDAARWKELESEANADELRFRCLNNLFRRLLPSLVTFARLADQSLECTCLETSILGLAGVSCRYSLGMLLRQLGYVLIDLYFLGRVKVFFVLIILFLV